MVVALAGAASTTAHHPHPDCPKGSVCFWAGKDYTGIRVVAKGPLNTTISFNRWGMSHRTLSWADNDWPPKVCGVTVWGDGFLLWTEAAGYMKAYVGNADAYKATSFYITGCEAPQAAGVTGPRYLRGCAGVRQYAFSDHSYRVSDLVYRYHYPFTAGDLGQGKVIAVPELEQVNLSDIAAFDACYFGAEAAQHFARVHVINIDGGSGRPPAVEAEMDVEILQALAPDATINVYDSPGYGFNDDFKAIAAADPSTVSVSWLQCEATTSQATLSTQYAIFKQMAAEGVNVFAASGDSGSIGYYCPAVGDHYVPGVDDPSSQPYVIGVGGTDFDISYVVAGREILVPESAWGASGGGVSAVWLKPPWQRGQGLSGKYRQVPDVAAFASPNPGLVLYAGGHWFGGGGTSIATPEWAAGITDMPCSPGFIAPKLYAHPSVMHDITVGDTDWLGLLDGKWSAEPGYDMATGLGSPNFYKLRHLLCP